MKNEKTTFNTAALQKRILLQYESINDCAARTGIKKDKLEGKEDFSLEDILSIRKEFSLNDREVMTYFFPDFELEEGKNTLINMVSLESIIRRLERIEDGLEALAMMTNGKIREVGDTISNEDFQNAFNFINEEIMDKVTDLRADLTERYFKGYDRIGKVG